MPRLFLLIIFWYFVAVCWIHCHIHCHIHKFNSVFNNEFNNGYSNYIVHPKLDLVNFAVRPLLFTKSCSSLNWICSKNEIGWNYSELKDINLKYILSKDSLRYININLPMFCNFQLLNIPIFQKNSKNHGKYPQNYPNIAKFQ